MKRAASGKGCLTVLPDAMPRGVQNWMPITKRESLQNPPKAAEELLATLESQGLTQAVARLRQFIDLL